MRQKGAKKLKNLKENKAGTRQATRPVVEWTFSSPKVPACQPMDKTNLASRQALRRHAEEIDDDDLARQKLQNNLMKNQTKKARRGATRHHRTGRRTRLTSPS
uniref:Uncharacterized protein n=1 Tax=Solanum tuberosum TaxID=4113 RepID=M1DTX3_SOLTU